MDPADTSPARAALAKSKRDARAAWSQVPYSTPNKKHKTRNNRSQILDAHVHVRGLSYVVSSERTAATASALVSRCPKFTTTNP